MSSRGDRFDRIGSERRSERRRQRERQGTDTSDPFEQIDEEREREQQAQRERQGVDTYDPFEQIDEERQRERQSSRTGDGGGGGGSDADRIASEIDRASGSPSATGRPDRGDIDTRGGNRGGAGRGASTGSVGATGDIRDRLDRFDQDFARESPSARVRRGEVNALGEQGTRIRDAIANAEQGVETQRGSGRQGVESGPTEAGGDVSEEDAQIAEQAQEFEQEIINEADSEYVTEDTVSIDVTGSGENRRLVADIDEDSIVGAQARDVEQQVIEQADNPLVDEDTVSVNIQGEGDDRRVVAEIAPGIREAVTAEEARKQVASRFPSIGASDIDVRETEEGDITVSVEEDFIRRQAAQQVQDQYQDVDLGQEDIDVRVIDGEVSAGLSRAGIETVSGERPTIEPGSRDDPRAQLSVQVLQQFPRLTPGEDFEITEDGGRLQATFTESGAEGVESQLERQNPAVGVDVQVDESGELQVSREERFGDIDFSFGFGDPDVDEVERFVDEDIGEGGTEFLRGFIDPIQENAAELEAEFRALDEASPERGPAGQTGAPPVSGLLQLGQDVLEFAEQTPRIPGDVLEGVETGAFVASPLLPDTRSAVDTADLFLTPPDADLATAPLTADFQESTERADDLAVAGAFVSSEAAEFARERPIRAAELGAAGAIGLAGGVAAGTATIRGGSAAVRGARRLAPDDGARRLASMSFEQFSRPVDIARRVRVVRDPTLPTPGQQLRGAAGRVRTGVSGRVDDVTEGLGRGFDRAATRQLEFELEQMLREERVIRAARDAPERARSAASRGADRLGQRLLELEQPRRVDVVGDLDAPSLSELGGRARAAAGRRADRLGETLVDLQQPRGLFVVGDDGLPRLSGRIDASGLDNRLRGLAFSGRLAEANFTRALSGAGTSARQLPGDVSDLSQNIGLEIRRTLRDFSTSDIDLELMRRASRGRDIEDDVASIIDDAVGRAGGGARERIAAVGESAGRGASAVRRAAQDPRDLRVTLVPERRERLTLSGDDIDGLDVDGLVEVDTDDLLGGAGSSAARGDVDVDVGGGSGEGGTAQVQRLRGRAEAGDVDDILDETGPLARSPVDELAPVAAGASAAVLAADLVDDEFRDVESSFDQGPIAGMAEELTPASFENVGEELSIESAQGLDQDAGAELTPNLFSPTTFETPSVELGQLEFDPIELIPRFDTPTPPSTPFVPRPGFPEPEGQDDVAEFDEFGDIDDLFASGIADVDDIMDGFGGSQRGGDIDDLLEDFS